MLAYMMCLLDVDLNCIFHIWEGRVGSVFAAWAQHTHQTTSLHYKQGMYRHVMEYYNNYYVLCAYPWCTINIYVSLST